MQVPDEGSSVTIWAYCLQRAKVLCRLGRRKKKNLNDRDLSQHGYDDDDDDDDDYDDCDYDK